MAHHSKILFPDSVHALVAIDYLAMVIIGGLGSILRHLRGDLHDPAAGGAQARRDVADRVYLNAFGLIVRRGHRLRPAASCS
jgi:hypothetical protein